MLFKTLPIFLTFFLMGLADAMVNWKATAFIVPLACFVYLLLLSLKGGQQTQKA